VQGLPAAVQYCAVAILFLASRLLLWLLGIRFESSALAWYWQVLDPALLRANLVESLAYFHVQPPLFNLLIGVVAKGFPDPAPVLAWLWTACGLGMTLVIQATLRRVGWGPVAAGLAATACALSLPWIAYENWLFYDFPCAALLLLGGYCLLRDAGRGTHGWAAAFAAVLTALAGTRSLFHLVWVLAAAALFVAASAPATRRRAAAWMLAPVLLVASLYSWNLAVFGFFGSSSWMGQSLTKMTVDRLSPGERAAWIRDGTLSPYAALASFSPLEAYEHAGGRRFPDDPIPVLGTRLRRSGHPNYNHRAFVEISRIRLGDALTVIARRPGLYAGAVGSALSRFFDSPVHYPPFKETLIILEPVYRIHAITFGTRPAAILVYALALALAMATWLRRGTPMASGLRAAAAWATLNLVWVLVAGSLLEVGENHRFRFTVLPLAWLTILACMGTQALRRPKAVP